MALQVDVGKRIKRFRQKHNLTLKEIEARVGVSATHISEIERGKTSPTIGALGKIADALGVDPALFLASDVVPAVGVVRASERESIAFGPVMFSVEPLSSPLPHQEMSAALCTWPPRQTDAPTRRHVGEEFGYLLEGQIEVIVGGHTYVLRVGDTIHFRANVPHQILNREERPAVGIWVTLPKFGF
jgi:transcriptional regulator with XRE-family HTH domain